jgi:DNA-binding winged helix-turn-helix (wHTH) protein/Tol biopolymer transport system component
VLSEINPRPRYRFGPFEVNPAAGDIYKSGVRVRVPKKPFQILLALLEHPGDIVTRENLRGRLWSHDTFVEFEHALNAAINRLRLVLGDDAGNPRYIETVPGRGYRLIAPVDGAPPVPIVITPPVSSALPRPRHWVWMSAIAVLAAFASGISIGRRSRPTHAPGPIVRFAIPPPLGAVFEPSTGRQPFQLSPDGRYLAFTARGQSLLRSLWIRDLDQPEAREVPETGDAYSVFWSPDSACLYYTSFASGVLRRVALSGGPQDLLAQIPPRFYGAWLYRGEIRSGDHEEGWAVPLSGGASRKLPMPQSWAQPLPDGRRVIYTAWNSARSINEVRLALPDQPGTTLFESDSRVFLTRSTRNPDRSWLLYMRGANLVARGFDHEAGQLTADGPVPIASHVPYFRSTGTVEASVAAGTLVWLDHPDLSQLVWADRQGHELSSVGPVLSSFNQVRLSKDGKWAVIAVIDRNRGVTDAWTIDMTTGSVRRVSNSNATMHSPVLSPDGRRIAYGKSAGRPPILAMLALEQGDVAPPLPEGLPQGYLQQPSDWSPDGRFIAETSIPYAHSADQQNAGIYLVDLARNGELVPLLTSPRQDRGSEAVFAPDGRAIAFLSRESGSREVYVQAFDPAGRRLTGMPRQISRGGALLVRWPQPGHELFYLGHDYCIYEVSLNGATKRLFQVSQEVVSRMHPPFSFDVASGGERFLLPAYRGDRPSSLAVVLNWENLVGSNPSGASAAPYAPR